jgi:signal transduction histidine kinase
MTTPYVQPAGFSPLVHDTDGTHSHDVYKSYGSSETSNIQDTLPITHNKRQPETLFVASQTTSLYEQQQELLSCIDNALLQERQRIAEELHDGVTQEIAHALHKLEYVQHLLEQSLLYQAFQEVTHIARILENGLQDLRHSIAGLLPRQLDQQTLLTSLITLIQEYQQDHPNIPLDFHVEPQDLVTHIPSELTFPIFRFVQQALNNSWQHTSASYIAISLTLLPELLTIEVCDNGEGFSPHMNLSATSEIETPTQFGLRIMRERIEHTGGTWEIQNRPSGGTCVRAIFPLQGANASI